MAKPEEEAWWPEFLAAKDGAPLAALAKRFDVGVGPLAAAMLRTGTRRTPNRAGPEAAAAKKSRSRRKGREKAAAPEASRRGSKDAKIEPFRDLLGTMPDREVAAKAGVAVRTIASYRNLHGIKGFSRPKQKEPERKTKRSPGPTSKLDAHRDKLGVLPDAHVASLAGVSRSAVRMYRVRHKIPAATATASRARQTPPPAPAVEPAPAPSTAPKAEKPASEPAAVATPVATPAATGSSYAWRVQLVLDGTAVERVVVGASVAQIGQTLERAGIADVLTIERIAEVIS